jgi:hypothetical protein
MYLRIHTRASAGGLRVDLATIARWKTTHGQVGSHFAEQFVGGVNMPALVGPALELRWRAWSQRLAACR